MLFSIHTENDERLHFSATHSHSYNLPGLYWRRNNAKLLHPAQVVPIDPGFEGLPVDDTRDDDRRRRDLLTCRRNIHEVALVGTTKCVAYHDTVSLSDQVFNPVLSIGEG